jgi:hypothetical protein
LGAGGPAPHPAEQRWEAGGRFSLSLLGPFRRPEPGEGVPWQVWERLAAEPVRTAAGPDLIALELLEQRQQLRAAHNWAGADALRRRLMESGWLVEDTPQGPRLRRAVPR